MAADRCRFTAIQTGRALRHPAWPDHLLLCVSPMKGAGRAFNLDHIRQRLARGGTHLWASLEELLDESDFRQWVEAEFPAAASFLDGPRRREFLKLMGASLMLAGVVGCKEDRSNLALPYVTEPEEEIPGVPRFYATAVSFDGF